MVYYSVTGYNRNMFLSGILTWWYTKGLAGRCVIVKERLAKTADFFSVNLMLKTLFAPFRQISASHIGGSLDVRLRAFFDRLLSRIIGAIMRIFMIIFGILTIVAQIVFSLILLIFWIATPLLPVMGLIIMITGWTV